MSSITLRFLAEPSTVNFGGKVHGGTVMKWIDEAGYACATSWSKRYCVTVFIGSIRFHRPIRIGELVEVEARMVFTGSTSMNISVEVRSGDMKSGGELQKTTGIIGTPLLEIHTKFFKPATYGERLQIHTSVTEWREKVLIHKHLVKRGDDLLCEGEETRAFCMRDPANPDRIKAIPIPPDIRALCT